MHIWSGVQQSIRQHIAGIRAAAKYFIGTMSLCVLRLVCDSIPPHYVCSKIWHLLRAHDKHGIAIISSLHIRPNARCKQECDGFNEDPSHEIIAHFSLY